MKIGWILTCGKELGNSSRGVGFIAHEWFVEHGVDSNIIFYNEGEGSTTIDPTPAIEAAIKTQPFTHIIFQKVCIGHALYYLKMAKTFGIKTVYTVDDFTEPESGPMEKEADIVVANSEFMREYVSQVYNREVKQLPCAYEVDKDLYKKDYHTDKFTVYWHGSLGNQQQAIEFQQMMSALKYKYELIGPSYAPFTTVPWTRQYHHELMKGDVVVLPCLHTMDIRERAKGDGRPVQSMILGIPTVVSPFPSYAKLITNGVDGFVCYNNTIEEFKEYLEYLQDEKVREEIGKAGRERVVDAYHASSICKRWLEILT